MAKEGLKISTIQPVLRNINDTMGWSICIGAGTSMPAVSDWYTLVERLIVNNCDKDDIIDIGTLKRLGFSADTMIQAVKNLLYLNDADFTECLSKEIYGPIQVSTNPKEWDGFARVHDANIVSGISQQQWKCYEAVKSKFLDKTTANLLAQVITRAIENEMAPKAILSFNCEAIFLSLLNYYYWKSGKGKSKRFDRIVSGISPKGVNRIPYIHCHGYIPIASKQGKKVRESNARLVFSEDSYLRLANSALSWQAINFIEHCMQTKMIFIGVSLTDSNMRRWLSWIHSNKLEEFKNNGIKYKDATEHFWINKIPKTLAEKKWIEESVAHLGVRLVWIDEWNQTGDILTKMLGI